MRETVTTQRKTQCSSRTFRGWLLTLLFVALINTAFSAQNTPIKRDFFDASLEELMNIKVSTISRKQQTLKETAAAVFVINQEDIRRSSANSIPELLRMAPGLSVSRIDGNKWSIT